MSAQDKVDRRAAKHGLGSDERKRKIQKAKDFFSKPVPTYSKDELRKMGHPVESAKVPAGMKFIASYVYKDANGKEHTHRHLRKGSKMTDPVVVYIDGKEWKTFQSFTKAKQAAINHIKGMKESVDMNEETAIAHQTPYGTVTAYKRDTKGMRGKQDGFKLTLKTKSGKTVDLGSHPKPTKANVMSIVKNVMQKESVDLDESLKVGDKVKFKKGIDPKMANRIKSVIQKSGKVKKVYGDGDVVVNFGGNNDVSVDAKLLVKESVELEENKIFFVKVGDGRDSMTVKTKARNSREALKKMRSEHPKSRVSLDQNQKQGQPVGALESVEEGMFDIQIPPPKGKASTAKTTARNKAKSMKHADKIKKAMAKDMAHSASGKLTKSYDPNKKKYQSGSSGRYFSKYESVELGEKAVSKSQQKFMGMVRSVQKGEMDAPSPEVAKAAKTMSKKDVKDFASTKHKGLPESSAEYGKSIDRIRDKEKNAAIKPKDRETLGKLADLMKKQKKRTEAYRKPTQAEIDADKRKDGKSKDSSTRYRDMKKKMYGNAMGGLKKEESQSVQEGRNDVIKALSAKAKTGGVDKVEFQKSHDLYKSGKLQDLKKLIKNSDTDVAEYIADVISRHDSRSFNSMYPRAKSGDRLANIIREEKYAVKYTHPTDKKSGKTTGPMSKSAADKKAAMGNRVDRVGGKYTVIRHVEAAGQEYTAVPKSVELTEATIEGTFVKLAKELADQANKKLPPREYDGNSQFTGVSYPITMTGGGRNARVWTRGDGRKYRKPAKIVSDLDHSMYAKVLKDYKKLMGGTPVDMAWKFITSKGKSLGKATGELGSDKPAPAYQWNGTVFIKRGSESIDIVTPSIFRNSWVWRTVKEEGLDEATFMVTVPKGGPKGKDLSVKVDAKDKNAAVKSFRSMYKKFKNDTVDVKPMKEVAETSDAEVKRKQDFLDRLRGKPPVRDAVKKKSSTNESVQESTMSDRRVVRKKRFKHMRKEQMATGNSRVGKDGRDAFMKAFKDVQKTAAEIQKKKDADKK